jgi:hypothetical protein
MTGIYKVAASVLVWLSPAADDINFGMDALGDIGTAAIGAGCLNQTREIMWKLWDADPTHLRANVREPFETLSKNLDLKFPQLARKKITERGYWQRTLMALLIQFSDTLKATELKDRVDGILGLTGEDEKELGSESR